MSLKIGWVGFHIEGLYAFENLLNKGAKFDVFITLNDEAMGKRSAGTRRYKNLCSKHNIPYYEVKNINDDDACEVLLKYSLDLLIVIGWSQILHSRVLNIPQIGCVGAHASLLPHNRGSAPVNWGIIKGETLAGNSLMWLNEGVDTGVIIDQIPIPVSKYDTCKTIYDEVAKTNYVLLDRLLIKLEEGVKPESDISNSDEGPILPRRRPADGIIDWRQDSNSIYNFIRGITKPYPGAYSFIDGEKWIIWKCALLPVATANKAGEILGTIISPEEKACGLIVSCGEGAIIILEMENEVGEILDGHSLVENEWQGKEWANE